jgi:Rrf2 family iron-sulfur cluster assembly transcriptional regulator
MLLSKSCEYGMRATLYIASLEQEGFVSIRDISERLDLSFHFLTKILQKLTHAGILHSFRGPNGGVALAKPAERITLEEIVVAIDGPELFTECILGLPSCGDQKACPMHEEWKEERARLKNMMSQRTLASLAEGINEHDYRLKDLELSTSPNGRSAH